MANYAIGDIQGCYAPLMALLTRIEFDKSRDQLWLVGDLVNRGPDSLAVLRWAKSQGSAVKAVLGNHDLHLLRVAEGLEPGRKNDTLAEILAAPDRQELLHWLRHLPLIRSYDKFILVHAGLLPQWSVEQASGLAREVEATLQSSDYRRFLESLYGDTPSSWIEDLRGMDRLRVITNACTRLRFCTTDGTMEFATKGGPECAPPGFMPWFEVPQRASDDATVIFGHWSALGLKSDANLLALDSGCFWGRQLSAVRLEDRQIFQVACDPGRAGQQ